MKTQIKTIDEYIEAFPEPVRNRLEEMRRAIHKAAPEAEEVISYQMPAFRQNGILVYFTAFKDHIGLFPTASGVEAFKKELARYKWSKGTIHFPYDEPMPLDLVVKIVVFRVRKNLQEKGGKSYSHETGSAS